MNWAFVAICMVVIAVLAWRIAVRVRLLNQRIEEVRDEMERNPLDPFSAWMELWRLIDRR
ncbi:MAG: hypothetical protein K6U12_03065 [Armatimonadetes bacterium]|jgi:hypothetical protein|nr:hypothetical protein [Armatimonadota bacterium]GBC90520.1 hypothetical protein HRbin14_01257 [bacterium HR14]GIV13373.1 MAG: hypothetical protein KatS3mg021_1655 [Fimbriimonadales bacterium]CUU11511.1 hypothetical protein GBSOP10_11195 [Armatimonadetes bacterium GBS]CUU38108.1 hypothetical protein DCOP10_123154 [Armatimonadetes bacterium DC]